MSGLGEHTAGSLTRQPRRSPLRVVHAPPFLKGPNSSLIGVAADRPGSRRGSVVGLLG